MNDAQRPPSVVLTETAPMLALLATRGLYREQPELWKMSERGRERTLEDFGHHFRALQSLHESVFRAHVEYCRNLFHARGFPSKWLDDAWRWMAIVMKEELPPEVAAPALAMLAAATRAVAPK